jgi:hypothetical protein
MRWSKPPHQTPKRKLFYSRASPSSGVEGAAATTFAASEQTSFMTMQDWAFDTA